MFASCMIEVGKHETLHLWCFDSVPVLWCRWFDQSCWLTWNVGSIWPCRSHAFEAVSCCIGVWQWLAAVARRGATRAKALPGWLQKVKLQGIHPCLEGDFPTFLSEFGGGDCRWDFLMILGLDEGIIFPLMAVDSVCPQGPTAVGKSDTAVELAKQLQLQGRKANGSRRSDDQLLTEILARCG